MATGRGTVELAFITNGSNRELLLSDVLYMPNLHYSLTFTTVLANKDLTATFDLNAANIMKDAQHWPWP